jgi:RimJ/RimL family protein N-acetyltransferase
MIRVPGPLGVADELETERLRLRQWRIDDWRALHRTYGDPDVMRWHGRPEGLSLEETAYAVGRMAMHWEARGFGMWAVEERDSTRTRRRATIGSRSRGRSSRIAGDAATRRRAPARCATGRSAGSTSRG